MVKAILEGRKTQTRRIIKPQPNAWHKFNNGFLIPELGGEKIKCPYQIGQTLWVRETWAESINSKRHGNTYIYKADGWEYPFKWKPSIFMPRWASRFNIEVTNIRVERLQDISVEDCKKEGIEIDYFLAFGNPEQFFKTSFKILWDSINKKRGYGWDVNPYVWVLEFTQKR